MNNKETITPSQLQKKWQKVWKHLNATNKELHIAINCGISEADKIKMRAFMSQWEKLSEEASSFYMTIDSFSESVERVEPVQLTLPWDDGDFEKAWKNWIAYMQEQHNLKLCSRTLEQRLAILKNLSGGDEKKAIEILNHSICNCYKAFYKRDEEEALNQSKTVSRRKDDDFS